MTDSNIDKGQGTAEGWVYVLRTKNFPLPVCKIGRTARDPFARCAEINKSSTGDFLWEVQDQIAVNHCQKLESSVHTHLTAKRQIGRELFDVPPSDAMAIIRSVLDGLAPDVRVITAEEDPRFQIITPQEKARMPKQPKFSARDVTYAHLLDRFNELLDVKGVPFGQLNKPAFGLSDGSQGVQWNLAVFPKDNTARVGVNLEGLKYRGWPIARLIQSELKDPQLLEVAKKLDDPQGITLRFSRDAWQAGSRLIISNEYLGGGDRRLSELSPTLWKEILTEALGCLDKEQGYQNRATQSVRLQSAPADAAPRTAPVSPHLTIWTAIDPSGDSKKELTSAFDRLKPIHDWARKVSAS